MPPRTELETIAQHMEQLRSDYDAVKSSQFRRRRTGISPNGSGADYHYRRESDYLKLLEYSRDLDRNDPIVGSITDRAVTATLFTGDTGFIVDPKTGDETIDADLKAMWNEWAEDADKSDAASEHDFDDLTRFAFRSELVDGDAIGLLLEQGSIQFTEGHRIRTPTNSKKNIVSGVLLDNLRKRLGYYVTKDDIDPMTAVRRVSDTEFIKTRDDDGWRQVCHVFNSKRYTGTRGITAYVPIFDLAGMHGDIEFAKLIQQQIVSCFAIFRQQQFDPNAIYAPKKATGETKEVPLGTSGQKKIVQGVSPGMEVVGNPGEELKGFSPNVPNPEFFDHVKLILTFIGINLGMPLVQVLMDASETNFSGFRGAIEQAKLGFRRNQKHLIKRWHRPIYWWKLRQWMAEDPILRSAESRLKLAFYAHQWTTPRWPYIEPLKDAQADLLRLRNGLTSERRVAHERGEDYDVLYPEVIEDREKKIRLAKQRAIAINTEFDDGDPVGWRELACLPNADGMTLSFAVGDSSNDSSNTPKPSGGKKNA